jgi:hypothetical protein
MRTRGESRGAFGLLLLSIITILGTPNEASADQPNAWRGGGQGYELSVDKRVKHGGKASGSVKATDQAKQFGTLTQGIRADKYRGKRLRMTAYVKSATAGGWAGLWMRVDGKEKTGLAFDNMMDRAIRGNADWKKYEVVLDVPVEAEAIFFGFLLSGKGQAWVDDIEFEEVGKDVKTTGLEVQPMDRTGDPPKGLLEAPRELDFEE